MFVIWRRTYTARTGTRSFDQPYQCGECGAQTMARVISEGVGTSTAVYGVGGNAMNARHSAEANASAAAMGAFVRAACPACGRFSRGAIAVCHANQEARAKRAKRRLPIAGALAAATFLLLAIGAVADQSGSLAVASVGSAACVAGLVFLLMSTSTQPPMVQHPQNVAFFWNENWFVPSVTYAPPGAALGRSTTLPGALLFMIGGVAALVSLIAWGTTFQSIWVVNTERAQHAITVKIDGKQVGKVTTQASDGLDAPVTNFSVRSGPHVVEAYSDDGTLIEKQNFTAGRGSEKTIFAPRADENGACVVLMESIYGSTSREPSLKSLDGDIMTVSFDDAFKDSPASMEVDQGSTVTRNALRVLDCKRSSDEDKPVAFSASGGSPARVSTAADGTHPASSSTPRAAHSTHVATQPSHSTPAHSGK